MKDLEKIRKTVIEEIKNGASLRQTAIKHSLPLSTVANWCNVEGIKSKHPRSPIKATKKEIIEAIKKNKVMTQNDLEIAFNYTSNTIRKRLIQLVSEGKITFVILPGGGGKVSEIFDGHIDKRLYYTKKEDLHKWIAKKLPKQMPSGLKRAITQKLHNSGIDFEFDKNTKKAIVVSEDTYDWIKKRADEKGISISKYVSGIHD
jgi:site-specific DNA-cytosine methylase